MAFNRIIELLLGGQVGTSWRIHRRAYGASTLRGALCAPRP